MKSLIILGVGVSVGGFAGVAWLMNEIVKENMVVSHNMDGTVTMNYREGLFHLNFYGPKKVSSTENGDDS